MVEPQRQPWAGAEASPPAAQSLVSAPVQGSPGLGAWAGRIAEADVQLLGHCDASGLRLSGWRCRRRTSGPSQLSCAASPSTWPNSWAATCRGLCLEEESSPAARELPQRDAGLTLGPRRGPQKAGPEPLPWLSRWSRSHHSRGHPLLRWVLGKKAWARMAPRSIERAVIPIPSTCGGVGRGQSQWLPADGFPSQGEGAPGPGSPGEVDHDVGMALVHLSEGEWRDVTPHSEGLRHRLPHLFRSSCHGNPEDPGEDRGGGGA